MIVNIGTGIEVDDQIVEQVKDLAGLAAMRYLAEILHRKEEEANTEAIMEIRANRDREAFGLVSYAQACQDIAIFISNMEKELARPSIKNEESVDKQPNKRFL